MIEDDDFLMMSGIQHYCFCPRQWALIHVEEIWSENYLTTSGELFHDRAHDEAVSQRRPGFFSRRGVRVASSVLRLTGICDVVEFQQDDQGVSVDGESGKWAITPVEYKRGTQERKADQIQLCAQVIALEEMFKCKITSAYLYHVLSKKRERIEMTQDLRKETLKLADEMSEVFLSGRTPPPNYGKSCKSCSLVDECLPRISERENCSLKTYIEEMIREG